PILTVLDLKTVNSAGASEHFNLQLTYGHILSGRKHTEILPIGWRKEICRISVLDCRLNLNANGIAQLLDRILFGRAIAHQVKFQAMRNPSVVFFIENHSQRESHNFSHSFSAIG